MSDLPSPELRNGLRVGFAGTPEFAAHILNHLLESEFAPIVVYTQPDQRAGRGQRLSPSAVKLVGAARELEIRQPSSWKRAEVISELAAFNLDVLVVAAYGLILPPQVLCVPRFGCINVHASVLPRWRGAAPIERAVMAGDETSGVSIMQMDEGLDTGAVFMSTAFAIGPDTTGPELEGALSGIGATSLLACLRSLPTLKLKAQSDIGVSYAHKITPNDAHINWHASAVTIHAQVRALTGRMPAFSFLTGCRVQVLESETIESSQARCPGEIGETSKAGIRVGCGKGYLLLKRIQLNRGKGRPLSAADTLNGYPELFSPGSRFSDEN